MCIRDRQRGAPVQVVHRPLAGAGGGEQPVEVELHMYTSMYTPDEKGKGYFFDPCPCPCPCPCPATSGSGMGMGMGMGTLAEVYCRVSHGFAGTKAGATGCGLLGARADPGRRRFRARKAM